MKKSILSITFALSSITAFGQTNYYVSPTGNNANSGTLALPWQTVQYGLDQLADNDTLNLLSGTYNEKVNIPASNICLRNHATDLPVIDASGITNQVSIIRIHNKSNVTVSGLELKNNMQLDAQGILVDGNSANVTIKNCKIHDIHFSSNANAAVTENTNAQGIIVYGTNPTTAISNLKIQNNELYNCRLGYSEGIAVNGNVDGFEVSGNLVYNLTNIGIDVIGHEGTCSDPANDQARNGLVKNNITHHCISAYASSGGLYIDGGKTIIVENNTSYHNGYGIEVGCENVGKTTSEIIIRNNIFYDNEICAIALGGFDYPSGSGKVFNAIVRNNTCYYNDFSTSGYGELYLSYSENTVIENNIFYTSPQSILSYAELTQPTIYFDYNIIYTQSGNNTLATDWNGVSYNSFTAFQSASGTNANSFFADPQFAAASVTTPDFHLDAGSVAINAGHPFTGISANEVDMDGESRANGIVECGADEYYATTGLAENTTSQLTIYPNPASTQTTLYLDNISSNTTVKIYNACGEQVKEFTNITGQELSIDRGDLEAGIYFVHLSEGNNTIALGKLVLID